MATWQPPNGIKIKSVPTLTCGTSSVLSSRRSCKQSLLSTFTMKHMKHCDIMNEILKGSSSQGIKKSTNRTLKRAPTKWSKNPTRNHLLVLSVQDRMIPHLIFCKWQSLKRESGRVRLVREWVWEWECVCVWGNRIAAFAMQNSPSQLLECCTSCARQAVGRHIVTMFASCWRDRAPAAILSTPKSQKVKPKMQKVQKVEWRFIASHPRLPARQFRAERAKLYWTSACKFSTENVVKLWAG